MKQLEGNLLELASNLLYACHGSAYILGGKKSLLVLDRFLHSFKASNLPHACHGSAYFLGGKKSLLVLDRFLYSFTASNLPHACHLSSKFLGGRNASVLLTDSLPAGKGEAQGVFSCQHQNFFPTLGFLLSFLKKQKCLTLPQGFHPEDYPQAKNMLLFLVSWVWRFKQEDNLTGPPCIVLLCEK